MLYIMQITSALGVLEERLKVHDSNPVFPRVCLFKDLSGNILIDYKGQTFTLSSFDKDTLTEKLSRIGIEVLVESAVSQFAEYNRKREADLEQLGLQKEIES